MWWSFDWVEFIPLFAVTNELSLKMMTKFPFGYLQNLYSCVTTAHEASNIISEQIMHNHVVYGFTDSARCFTKQTIEEWIQNGT